MLSVPKKFRLILSLSLVILYSWMIPAPSLAQALPEGSIHAREKEDTGEKMQKMFALSAPYMPVDMEEHWALDVMYDLVYADILKGYGNARDGYQLRPEQPITRAEFVSILVRALQLKENPARIISFSDVPAGAWYSAPVRIASSLGIVNGMGKGHFAPDRKITREEIAAIVVRAFQSTVPFRGQSLTFQDVSANWSRPYIEQASAAGIVKGLSAGVFGPKEYAKRAQAAAMIHRALRLERTDVPSDETLISTVIKQEQEHVEAFNNKDWKRMQEVADRYASGFYKAMLAMSRLELQSMSEEGYTVKIRPVDKMTARVKQKSNRFATVELQNARYEVITRKNSKTYSRIMEDSSGMYSLKKGEDGQWRIYGVEPGDEAES